MAYRNGTYVTFHAGGTTDPTESDMKYYRLMEAWREHDEIEFTFVNSHDKTAAVRDTSLRQTLMTRLKERLNNSKNMILILSDKTKLDTDWVPFEIGYAIDECKIPVIAAYVGATQPISDPKLFAQQWPDAFRKRVETGLASVIHVPFLKAPIKSAISQFNYDNLPRGGSLGIYSSEAYQSWGIY